MSRRDVVKSILWFLAAFGLTFALFRLKSGLGATTAVTDAISWGLWNGVKISMVALSAGGFVLAGAVYVFHIERLRPVLRATVLTSFLGYSTFATLLTLDLGLPWHIWFPMINWQHHSVLFEVAVCVMLYLTVLALEVAPMVLEHSIFHHPFFKFIYRVLKSLTVPIVILGIMLSTLHQSSLGALFLIMPFRTHVLWYSNLIYLLYFVSAVALGLSVVIAELSILSRLYDYKPKLQILQSLGRASSVVLLLYFFIRFVDLAANGNLPAVFEGTWKSNLFILEMGLGVLLPAILYNMTKIRSSANALFGVSLFVVAGIFANRQNIFLTMSDDRTGNLVYLPTFAEFAMIIGLVSCAVLALLFFVENFKILSNDPIRDAAGPAEKPVIRLGRSLQKPISIFSLAIVLGVGLAFATMPQSMRQGYKYPPTPVVDAVGWDTLMINGNRAKEGVMFPHAAHQQRIGHSQDSCMTCHHMSKPEDGPTSCYECHKDMYLVSSIFDHKRHQDWYGDTKSCGTCHSSSKRKESAKKCSATECHPGMLKDDTSFVAVSYVDAMHGTCQKCHEATATELNNPELGLCSSCHPGLEEQLPSVSSISK